jgi:hypothetical protein
MSIILLSNLHLNALEWMVLLFFPRQKVGNSMFLVALTIESILETLITGMTLFFFCLEKRDFLYYYHPFRGFENS